MGLDERLESGVVLENRRHKKSTRMFINVKGVVERNEQFGDSQDVLNQGGP